MKAKVPATAHSPNLILGVVLVAYLMILLDLSIVYTGIPAIGRSMQMGTIAQTWVQNAYLLFFGGFLLLSSRLGDTLGRRRVFQAGVVLFTLASLVIGVSQTPVELIAARAVQGLGASILAPSVLAIISDTFAEGDERTRALAWYSIVAGVGASLGMVLGGIFAGLLSWRIGFLINIPIGIALFMAIGRVVPENERQRGQFDILGAVGSTLGMGLLVYGLVSSADAGWLAPPTVAALGGAALVLSLFIWHESRVSAPVLPLRLFQSAERSAAYAARMLFVGAMVAFFFFGAQFMQEVLGYSALGAGLGFLPMTLLTFVSAMAIPWVSQRIGGVPMLMIALALIAAGLLWMSGVEPGAPYWRLGLPMVLIGAGNGAAMAPLTLAGVRGVRPGDQGAASGLVNVAHQLGGSLGLSLLIVVFAANAQPGLTGAALIGHQIDAVLFGAAVMIILALVLSALFLLPAGRRVKTSS